MNAIDWNSEINETFFGLGISIVTIVLCYILNPAMGWLEMSSVLFNLTCVYLTVREKILAWVFGLIGVILLGFFFYDLGLYSSMILNAVFFAPIQFYGLWSWLKNKTVHSETLIPSFVAGKHWFLYGAFIAIGTYLWGTFMGDVGATQPYMDAAILFFSMVAQYLLVHKKIDSWFVWVIVNFLSIYVYASAGAMSLVLLYVVFLWMNYLGIKDWLKTRKEYRETLGAHE